MRDERRVPLVLALLSALVSVGARVQPVLLLPPPNDRRFQPPASEQMSIQRPLARVGVELQGRSLAETSPAAVKGEGVDVDLVEGGERSGQFG